MVSLALKVTKRTVAIDCEKERVRPEGSEVVKLICDASLAEGLAGWKPLVSLDEGLKRTADFIADNLQLYRIGEYAI